MRTIDLFSMCVWPRPSVNSNKLSFVFKWLLTMNILKRNMSKSILIIESWVINDQGGCIYILRSTVMNSCRLVHFFTLPYTYTCIWMNTMLNSWGSTMALHQRSLFFFACQQWWFCCWWWWWWWSASCIRTYRLNIYPRHAHISHVTFWVSNNSWNLNICVKLYFTVHLTSFMLDCFVDQFFCVIFAFSFKKNHWEFPV